jgi:hypothetical protein
VWTSGFLIFEAAATSIDAEVVVVLVHGRGSGCAPRGRRLPVAFPGFKNGNKTGTK